MKFFPNITQISNCPFLYWAYPYGVQDIPVVEVEMSDPLVSLPIYLYSMMEGTQHAYEHDPCSQHPLEYAHFQNYISVSTNHDSDAGHRLEELGIDILWPIQYGNLNCLSNVNSFGSLSFNKTKTFIETKVTAMKLQGFNL